MTSPFLISLASGLVSALLFLSGTTGSGLGAILMMLSALPLFIAGFGFGVRGVLIAAGSGSILIGFLLGGAGPLFYLFFAALPALVLTYLALLRRSVTFTQAGAQPSVTVEWFPAGSLILTAAALSALSATVVLVTAFGTSEQYDQSIKAAIAPVFEALAKPLTEGMTPEDVERLRANFLDQAAQVLPAVFGVSAMVIGLGNMWLAGYAARRSGFIDRPWLPIQSLDYPKTAALVLVAAIVASRTSGILELTGTALAGTLVFAYFILGAVTLIALTLGTGMRPVAILAIVLSIIIEPFAIFLAIFGLAETFAHLRARKAAAAQRGAIPRNPT